MTLTSLQIMLDQVPRCQNDRKSKSYDLPLNIFSPATFLGGHKRQLLIVILGDGTHQGNFACRKYYIKESKSDPTAKSLFKDHCSKIFETFKDIWNVQRYLKNVQRYLECSKKKCLIAFLPAPLTFAPVAFWQRVFRRI